MKLSIIVAILTFVISFLISRFIKYSNYLNDVANSSAEIEINNRILTNVSIQNARIVNLSLANRNAPLDPDTEFFSNAGYKGDVNLNLPECKLLKLERTTIDFLPEDANGPL